MCLKHMMWGMILLLSLLSAPSVWAEKLIVFGAQGVSLQPGQTVDGTQLLKLDAGQKVSLIASDGRMFKLEGPFNQRPTPKGSAKKANIKQALSNLMESSDTDSGSFGVMRSADDVFNMAGKESLPSPWLIDVNQSGVQCHLQGERTIFWRADKTRDAKVVLRMDGRWWDTRWPAGKGKLLLPDTIPLADGKTFRIEVNDIKTDITLNLIPGTVTEKLVQAAWMKEKNCKNQFLALAKSLAE